MRATSFKGCGKRVSITNFTLDLFQLWPMAASTLISISENDIIQMACAADAYTCQVKLQFLNDIMWEIGVEAAAMGNGLNSVDKQEQISKKMNK